MNPVYMLCPDCERQHTPTNVWLQYRDLVLYPEIGALVVHDVRHHVERRAAQILAVLIRHAGYWVHHQTIADACGMWHCDVRSNLTVHVCRLRRLLDGVARIQADRAGHYGLFPPIVDDLSEARSRPGVPVYPSRGLHEGDGADLSRGHGSAHPTTDSRD